MEGMFSSVKTRGFAPFLMGCASLHAWIHATVTAPVYDIQAGSFVVFSISSGVLLVALVLSVVFRKALERVLYRPAFSLAVALVSSVGTVLISDSLLVGPPPTVLTVAATALTALGTCGFLVIWGQAYAHLENIQACILATFGALGASFLAYLLINPFPQLFALAATALLPLVSAACARSVLKAGPRPSEGHGPREGPRAKGGPGPKGRLGRRAGFGPQAEPGSKDPFGRLRAARPPLRLFVYIFAFSVPLNYLNLQMQSESGSMTSPDWSLVYSCALLVVGAAIAVEYVLRRRNISALSLLMVLLATTSLLLRVFVGLQNQVLLYIFMYSGYYLFVATFYTRLGLIAFEGASRPFVVFALGNSFNVLGLLSGTLVGAVSEGLENPWLAVVSVLLTYALFFVGFIVMANIRRKNVFVDSETAVEKQGAPPSLAGFVEALCSIAAKEKGLTAREEEVLAYLVRGRSIQSIADEVTLSPNTVKTHARHIYEKLDAHTREELVAAVEKVGTRP
ncbi:MAG: helix-turn-helix transcriptional regulator [Coriobacteriales bacterium]|jgi:DNA-binding CsgD family transcriptional regulator|nr:helix-turn-helix transcriptional regulator [Coriobacteriales bacterium]